MSERRRFLKTVAAAPAGALLLPLFSATGAKTMAAECEAAAEATGGLPKNIIYTAECPGVWKGKEAGHVPVVESDGADGKLKVTVTTNHGMSESHYIVRHTLVDCSGEVLGATTFFPDDEPESDYTIELPAGEGKKVFVMSYCNLHDLWMTQVELKA